MIGIKNVILSVAARKRAIVNHYCVECGKPFKGLKIARYCCRACQVRAYRRRKLMKGVTTDVSGRQQMCED